MTECRYYNTKQAAEALGISVWTMREKANDPSCPVIRRGRLYFDPAKLFAWWEKGSKK